MAVKAVQQIMLGSVCRSEKEAAGTLSLIRDLGYEGIELNGFMIRKTYPIVRVLTRAAGMPVGKGGGFDWVNLVKSSGLSVVAVHEDLGTIERDPDSVLREADSFGTDKIVITGLYRFDMSDRAAVRDLAERLNKSGRVLKEGGRSLLYHNHNSEFRKLSPSDAGGEEGEADDLNTAYDYLMDHTDPEYVNFEFDSYWPTEAGVNVPSLMKRLGTRMKLWHINDRGTRMTGPSMTPILKSDCMELGYGNMDLETLTAIALSNGIRAVILETQRNFAEKSPLTSIRLSSGFMNSYFK